MILMLWLACSGPAPTADTAGSAAWENPDWEGDGLPDSQYPTEDEDPRRDDTGGGSTGNEALEDVALVDGVFAWWQAEPIYGYLVLATEAVSCAGVYGYTESPDGVIAQLIPPPGATGSSGWEASYRLCTSGPPCIGHSSWALGTEYGELDDTQEITVLASSKHELTVTWNFGADAGGELTVYNCGDGDSWD